MDKIEEKGEKGGEQIFIEKMDKIVIAFHQNSEFLAVTYGAFVMQILNDYKNIEEANS